MTKPTLLLFVNILLLTSLSGQSNADRPNIVWIVTEDNSKHYLRLYEEGGAPMPHIEALAKKGITFNYAFSNAPVCSVARSTLITGCYAPRIGVQYHRKMELAPMPDRLKMFPEYLHDAGYYTTNNSKEDYNLIKSDKVWDESSRRASYRNRATDQPFFHVQNFGITHEGQLHFSKGDMNSTPTQTSTTAIEPFPYHPNTATYRYTNARYHDLHQKADEAIGKFLEQLEADGLMDNTIIFYYGDHGGVLPRSKGYIYETGIHVPLVVYIPERWAELAPVELGTRSDAFVQFIDFGPTVLNLAGVEVPVQMDGKPFLGGGVTKADWSKRNTAFSYADRFDEKYDLVRAYRKGKYKYIRNYQPFNIDGLYNFYRYKMLAYQEWAEMFREGQLNTAQQQFFSPKPAEALYDLENDPYELYNLADDYASANVLMELRTTIQNQVKSMPDLSFYPEPYFLENGLQNPVQFGQENKSEIAELVDIADLSLVGFAKAKKEIKRALKSPNLWKRYWGLIVCNSFGIEAKSFFKRAKKMVRKDKENLVRMRAVEFLVLNDQPVSEELVIEIIKAAKTKTEANLMLNSIALLKMVKPTFGVSLTKEMFNPEWMARPNDLVYRRFEFLNGIEPK